MNRLFLNHILLLLLFPISNFAQGVLDQPDQDLAWESRRDMTEATYEAKLDELKAEGFRPTDVEILGGTSRKYACIWRKNTDGRAWEVRTKLTDSEFHTKWEEMKNSGFRPIDQECHTVNNVPYYGAIWIKNTENLQWASFRKLTSAEFSEKFDQYKGQYIPVDVDAYEVGGQLLYSVIWVENKNNLAWVEKRNIPQADFGSQFDEYSDKGYRLYSTESYRRNGNQEYATIWVKEPKARRWAARRDMSSNWFHNYWTKYRDLGYRLEDIEVYNTSDGIRYAGVWLENEDRMDWKHRDAVQKLGDDYFKDEPTAGMSIAVAVDGKIQFMRGWGFQDVDAQEEAHGKTVYRLASVSKALSGTMAFRLKAKNKLDLSKPTRDYEPRLPAHHTHTVGQLLSNRGKVRHYKDNDPATIQGMNPPFPNAYEATKLFSADPLMNPANGYLYSTHGYTCAAAAMEKAAGKLFPKIMQDEITVPFDLPTLACEDLSKSVEERSRIYQYSGGNFSKLTPLSLSWKYAGGGMESSAYDLARFGAKLLKGDILSQANLTAMTTEPTDTEDNYAYGWVGSPNLFSKDGSQPGSRAYIRCYKAKKVVVVILCNTKGDDESGIGTLGKSIGDLIEN